MKIYSPSAITQLLLAMMWTVSYCSEIETLENAAKRRGNETLTEKNLLNMNNNNYLEVLQKQAYGEEKDKVKPLFLLFASRDNEDSWKYSKDWILLSSIAYKQYTIARTDCQFDFEVCDKWEITSYPFVLFFKNNMIFKYTGSLSIETTLKYLSVDNYKSSEYATVYHENLFEYVSHMDGSFDFVTRMRRMSD